MAFVRNLPQHALWVFALVALGVNSAMTIYSVLELIQNAERVKHSNRVLMQIRSVLSGVKDAETGQRGYLLTENYSYLDPQRLAMRQLPGDIEKLRMLTQDNPAQQESLDNLEPVIASKLVELELGVAIARSIGRGTAAATVNSDLGREQMRLIRNGLNVMTERETELLETRTALAESKLKTTIWTTAIGDILTLGMTGFAFVAIRRDLEKRRRTEQQLIRSASELSKHADELANARRRAVESLSVLDNYYANTPIGLAFLDATLRIVRINRVFAQAVGRTPETLVGMPLADLNDSFLIGTLGDMRKVISSRTAIVDRLLHQPQATGGDDRIWEASCYPVTAEDGTLLGVGLIASDITARLRSERELRVSQGRFRSLAEAMPQIVWVARPDGVVEYFNQRWIDYTGLPFEESIGSGWLRPLHPDDSERARKRWSESTGSGLPYEIEYRFKGKDGVYRWFLGRALSQRDEEGRIVNWFGTCTDMHERKTRAEALEEMVQQRTLALSQSNTALVDEVEVRREAERKQTEAVEELRRSNLELEQFAYVASHDLQEPLRKIQAFSDRLAEKFTNQLGEQGQDYLERITRSSARMRTLINDLLAFSRVSTRAVSYAEIDLTAVVREAQSDLEESISQSGGRIEVGPLPIVKGDAMQFQQLFVNLLGNALKFRRPDVPPLVRVSSAEFREQSEHPRDMFRIEVRDNGIGFDQQYADRIFQIFQRLHGRNEYEGTGIGLAICKKIVERHAGRIMARSKAGEGTVFIIELPAVPPAVSDSRM